ncbi:MAG: SDR family oxidoreductase [Candidatus Schekmanbacteria bacterium]|nr:SDR family oxidoreductase [Candidatus Schekmanbacteria bacterium]
MTNNYLQSLFSLENKTAVITGAGGFFGKAFSETLLCAGAKVILFGRGEKIKTFVENLASKHNPEKIDCRTVDFYDENEYKQCLKDVVEQNKSIDILVNNAYEFSKNTGFNDQSGRMENISKDQWMNSLESGVYWHALAIQVVGEQMKRQRSGSIINISSMYSLVSPDPGLYEGTTIVNPPSYGAAKAAILALTRYTASFYGGFNIRCNAIAPGAFPNLGGDSYNSPKDTGFIKKLSDKTALRRVGKLDDLKGALVYLASDASSYVTGQTIIVDGGWTVR